MTLHKEYHTLENNQEIKFSISFNRDLTNWATYQKKKIGYEVHALPIKRKTEGNFTVEEFGAFTGFNANLLEVTRQSSKRLLAAIAILKDRQEMYLDYFRVSHSIMTNAEYEVKYQQIAVDKKAA